MNNRTALLVLLLWCLGVAPLQALDPQKEITQYHQDFWSEEDGLPQASVQAITQTRENYLWLGTRDGLARFDGLKFTVFRVEDHPELGSNDIRTLYEDKLGRLWIGTFNSGVSCYSNGVFQNYGSAEGLPGAGVLEVFQDSNGRIWLGGWGGISRFNRGFFEAYDSTRGVEGKNGWSFCEDAQGGLWAATDRAVHVQTDEGFKVVPELGAISNIRKLLVDRRGALWIGTIGNGLIRFDQSQVEAITTREGLSDNRVRAIAEDPEGNIWVGTWDGLNRVQGERVDSLPSAGGKIEGMIEALYIDREGSLWVGIRGGGLGRLRDARFTNFTMQEGLPSKLPRCVFQDSRGTVWIGTDGGGLACLKEGQVQVLGRKEGLGSEFVPSVTEDHEGNIWAGLGRPAALAMIQENRIQSRIGREQGLRFEYSVRAVYCDRRGVIWAGGDGGLCRVENGRARMIEGLPSALVRWITEDSKGNLWVATDDGLCLLREDRVVSVYGTEDGLSHNAVYAILTDPEGGLWLGTQRGLSRYENGRFLSFSQAEGMFQGTIYDVLDDELGKLWISSSRGIATLSKENLQQIACGKTGKVEITWFGIADGLKSTQCQGGSQSPGCRMEDGTLWFATLESVAMVEPGAPDRFLDPPKPLLEDSRVDRESVDFTAEPEFPAGTEDVEFHYTALHFITPEKVQFRYQLEGHDRSWVYAQTRRAAFYNNLGPGTYRFKVCASSDGKAWSEATYSLSFILLPHFYQTSWFYFLCATSLAGAIWSFHRVRMRRAQEKFSIILGERTRIARDLHDTLAQGFAGTAFQLEALGSRLREAAPETKRQLRLALTMVRHSFNEARRAVLNLRSPMLEEGNLVDAVRQLGAQMLSETDVKLEVRKRGKPRRLGEEVENQLLRICQEALANAVKHGQAQMIEISFDFTEEPAVTIHDDGVGFDPGEKPNGHHFGLKGMHERAGQLGGEVKIESGPGRGTTVKVYLK